MSENCLKEDTKFTILDILEERQENIITKLERKMKSKWLTGYIPGHQIGIKYEIRDLMRRAKETEKMIEELKSLNTCP